MLATTETAGEIDEELDGDWCARGTKARMLTVARMLEDVHVRHVDDRAPVLRIRGGRTPQEQ